MSGAWRRNKASLEPWVFGAGAGVRGVIVGLGPAADYVEALLTPHEARRLACELMRAADNNEAIRSRYAQDIAELETHSALAKAQREVDDADDVDADGYSDLPF